MGSSNKKTARVAKTCQNEIEHGDAKELIKEVRKTLKERPKMFQQTPNQRPKPNAQTNDLV